MDCDAGALDTLTSGERAALRAVLVRATAAAGRHRDVAELAGLVTAAPIEWLPAGAALHRVGGTVLRGLDGIDGWCRPDVLSRDFTMLSHLANSVPVYDVMVPWGPPFPADLAGSLAALARAEV